MLHGGADCIAIYQHNIQTDWQHAVLRAAPQQNYQGRLAGSCAGTRFTLSGNYFDQTGVIPGQGLTRGNAFASVDHSSDRTSSRRSASFVARQSRIRAKARAHSDMRRP